MTQTPLQPGADPHGRHGVRRRLAAEVEDVGIDSHTASPGGRQTGGRRTKANDSDSSSPKIAGEEKQSSISE